MISDVKVVAQILEVVTHWTLTKFTGIKHENIFWTWEFPASTPVLNLLAIMSVLGQYLCSPWAVARVNILVKWFIGRMFFSFQEQVDDLLLQSAPSQNGCQGCWQKDRCDSPRSNMSQRIYKNNSCSDHKMPRTRAGEWDQERVKNGGYSHGKSHPFSVPTEQKEPRREKMLWGALQGNTKVWKTQLRPWD